MGVSNIREEIFPPLARSLAPENCRYHAASKVMRITDPMALPVGVANPLWLTAWVYHRITAPPSCLYLGDGTAANQTMRF
jgi:hypothetical protein